MIHPAQADQALPVVLDSPHSWGQWPQGVPTAASPAALQTTWDAHVDELWRRAAQGRAPLLAAQFHRSYIDANRASDDIDPQLLNGPWPTPLRPTAKSQRSFGLIRHLALPGVPMYNAPLAVADVQARIAQCYAPYHAALAQLIADTHARHGVSLHIDCHSMKSVGNAMNDDAGQPRPDLVVSDLDGRTCPPSVTQDIADMLRSHGYGVSINHPYKGGELIRRHANLGRRCYSVQIEINRALYMNESTCAITPGFDTLAQHLGAFVGALGRYVMSLPALSLI